MNRLRYIFRVVFFLLAVLLLVDLNRKTDDTIGTIADFKFRMIEKIRTDSLDAKHKLDLLLKETTTFIDDSSHVKKGIHHLLGLVGLWGVIELGFFILQRRNDDKGIR